MTAAVVGLVGVFVGALMSQVGAILADRRQTRNEAVRWQRDQKTAAHNGTIRHLLRAANRRSKMTAKGGAIISQEDIGQMFDDLVEAQFWLHTLVTRCGAAQAERVSNAAQLLDEFVDYFASSGSDSKGFKTIASLQKVRTVVTECAREDGGIPAAGVTGSSV